MNDTTTSILLGFYDDVGTYTVTARQGDNLTRKIQVELDDKVQKYVIEDTTYIYLKEKYSDGVAVPPILIDKNNLSEDGTYLYIPLTDVMLAVSGVAKCEISMISATEEPIFDSYGRVLGTNNEILTTQTFNLYVTPDIYRGCSLSKSTLNALDVLFPLVVRAQTVLDNMDFRDDNEETRIANENLRVAAEALRQAAEANRILNYDRIIAMNDGGTYVDDQGETHTIINKYTKADGTVIDVDTSELDNSSFAAIAAYAKTLIDDDYWAQFAKSYAVGDSLSGRADENTDNAKYYAEIAKQSISGTYDISLEIGNDGYLYLIKTYYDDQEPEPNPDPNEQGGGGE